MDDLEMVGKGKLLGYLPLDTIRSMGVDPFVLEKRYRARGLYTKIFLDGSCHVGSGALYVANLQLLGEQIRMHESILRRNKWPATTVGFIDYVATVNVSPLSDLYNFISEVFREI